MKIQFEFINKTVVVSKSNQILSSVIENKLKFEIDRLGFRFCSKNDWEGFPSWIFNMKLIYVGSCDVSGFAAFHSF